MRQLESNGHIPRRRRWIQLALVASAFVLSETAEVNDPKLDNPPLPHAATLSVFDAVTVVGRWTWWGFDGVMESAGYGET